MIRPLILALARRRPCGGRPTHVQRRRWDDPGSEARRARSRSRGLAVVCLNDPSTTPADWPGTFASSCARSRGGGSFKRRGDAVTCRRYGAFVLLKPPFTRPLHAVVMPFAVGAIAIARAQSTCAGARRRGGAAPACRRRRGPARRILRERSATAAVTRARVFRARGRTRARDGASARAAARGERRRGVGRMEQLRSKGATGELSVGSARPAEARRSALSRLFTAPASLPPARSTASSRAGSPPCGSTSPASVSEGEFASNDSPPTSAIS